LSFKGRRREFIKGRGRWFIKGNGRWFIKERGREFIKGRGRCFINDKTREDFCFGFDGATFWWHLFPDGQIEKVTDCEVIPRIPHHIPSIVFSKNVILNFHK
jgi:hypothetical protein